VGGGPRGVGEPAHGRRERCSVTACAAAALDTGNQPGAGSRLPRSRAVTIAVVSMRRKKRRPLSRRFFYGPDRSGDARSQSTAGGAREPQGSPVLMPVRQPCIARHLGSIRGRAPLRSLK
jgi:hypothetical protein